MESIFVPVGASKKSSRNTELDLKNTCVLLAIGQAQLLVLKNPSSFNPHDKLICSFMIYREETEAQSDLVTCPGVLARKQKSQDEMHAPSSHTKPGILG